MKELHFVPNARIARMVEEALKYSANTIHVCMFPFALSYDMTSRLPDKSIFDDIEYDRFIIWHGNDVESRLWLYWCSTVIDPLYHIDISSYRRLLIKHNVLQRNNPLIAMGSMSEAGVRLVAYQDKKVHLLQRLLMKWRWEYITSHHSSGIRVQTKTGRIYSLPKDHYDTFILEHCPEEFKLASLCKAAIWLELEHKDVPYVLLDARILYLIWKKRLLVKPVRSNSQIKLSGSLIRLEDVPFEIHGVICRDFNAIKICRAK